MTVWRPTTVLMVFGLMLSGCSGEPLSLGSLESRPSPALPGSTDPGLTLGLDGKVHLSWIDTLPEGGHGLRHATWTGDGWSAPGTVARGTDWFVNWADVPSLAVGPGGAMAAHWLQKSDSATYAYDVRLAVSRDGGVTWGDSFTPHEDETATEHGFASIVPDAEGGFDLVWLDGRETGSAEGMAGEDTASVHDAGQAGGPMTLRHAYVSPDDRLSPSHLLDDRVCDCCPTSAVRTSDGSLTVVYRNRDDNEVRDIGSVRGGGDTWRKPRTVHVDGWTIAGCPVNGPAITGKGDYLACAWFTMGANNVPRVHLAFSRDGGDSFLPPVQVDDGNPIGRVDVVLLPDDSAVVSWIEALDTGAEIRMRRVAASGQRDPSRALVTIANSRASGYPRLERIGSSLILAWTDAEGDLPQVKTSVMKIPAIQL